MWDLLDGVKLISVGSMQWAHDRFLGSARNAVWDGLVWRIVQNIDHQVVNYQ